MEKERIINPDLKNELEERLSKLGVKVKISEDTKRYIAKQGFDSVF